MSKFRKKPVVIVAHRIGDDKWPDEIWEGVIQNEIRLYLYKLVGTDEPVGHVAIETLEGVMTGGVGDWIIRGVAGEFYICKDDIFQATYEPVE